MDAFASGNAPYLILIAQACNSINDTVDSASNQMARLRSGASQKAQLRISNWFCVLPYSALSIADDPAVLAEKYRPFDIFTLLKLL